MPSNTTAGPKGAQRPNALISGAAIVYGTVVKRGADVTHAIQGTNACVPLGIAVQDQPTAERAFALADQPGESVEGRSGAAFALDALLMSDANGKLITATTGNPVAAIARQAATAADQWVPVEVAPRGMLAP